MARCNCSPWCYTCSNGPCDCTCKAEATQPPQPVSQEVLEALELVEQKLARAYIDTYKHSIKTLCAALRNFTKGQGDEPS